MAATDRLDLKLSSSDKQLLQQAAAIEGADRAVSLSRRDYDLPRCPG